MPEALRVLLIGGALRLLALVLAFGVENVGIQRFLVGGFAGLLAFTVLLATSLDFPFSGGIRVDPAPFTWGLLAVVWAP